MPHRPPPGPNARDLPAEVAARLLARASELDVAYGDDVAVAGRHAVTDLRAVADLRAAATEAGISARAFDAALAELEGAEQAPVPDVAGKLRRRPRMWALAVGVATVIAAGVVTVVQLRPWTPTAPTVEEAFVFRCMSAEEATSLILPVLGDPRNTQLSIHPSAPRVLTVRTTPAQMRNVRTVLAEHEGTGSPATCPARPTSAVIR